MSLEMAATTSAGGSAPPPPSAGSSLYDELCFSSSTTVSIFIIFNVSNILLLLPLSAAVLALGLQRWRRRRPISHSDFFSYNMAAMELVGVSGSVVGLYGSLHRLSYTVIVNSLINCFPWYAEMLFPILISAERYLAVVHPVLYIRLKRGRTFRNISAAGVWLLCLAGMGVARLIQEQPEYSLIPAGHMAASLGFLTFCSLSILCVLIRPRPGDGGGASLRADRVKWRAFQTTVLITAALSVKFTANLVSNVWNSAELSRESRCLLRSSTIWFNLPGGLLLPLHVLHRAGKLPGCRRRAD